MTPSVVSNQIPLHWIRESFMDARAIGYDEFTKFWYQFYGRGPSKQWFEDVTSLLEEYTLPQYNVPWRASE